MSTVPVVSYLTDFGVGLGIGNVISLRPAYPMMTPGRRLVNMRVNVQLPAGLGVLPPGTSLQIDLLRSNTPVLSVGYAAGSGGGQNEDLGAFLFAPGDEIDVRVTAIGTFGTALPASVTATVGAAPPP